MRDTGIIKAHLSNTEADMRTEHKSLDSLGKLKSLFVSGSNLGQNFSEKSLFVNQKVL